MLAERDRTQERVVIRGINEIKRRAIGTKEVETGSVGETKKMSGMREVKNIATDAKLETTRASQTGRWWEWLSKREDRILYRSGLDPVFKFMEKGWGIGVSRSSGEIIGVIVSKGVATERKMGERAARRGRLH